MNPRILSQVGINDLEVAFVIFGREMQWATRKVSRSTVGLLRVGRGVEHRSTDRACLPSSHASLFFSETFMILFS